MAFDISAALNKRSGNRKKLPISNINITPVVDVMLVLLIIFMIASPMLISGVNVDLPETSATPLASNEEPLSVTLDKLGNVYLMQSKIPKSELISKLKAISKENYNTRIFVRGDKNVSYGTVIELVSTINAAGFTKVSLITSIKQNDK
ncbi:MAG: biopolymer transporter ExbD [Rickettsiaceae bacterium]|nr:biopolymer transporter ExbD [Rickettsiaceae bacterium]